MVAPIYAGTTAGQQLMQLNKTLQSITGMATPDVQNIEQGAQQNALQLQANQPQYMQQEQQNIGQSLGIPQLMGQYGNLSKLFELFQHDNSMAGKYGNVLGGGGNLNPFADPTLTAASSAQMTPMQQGNQADIQKVAQMTTPNQPGATIAAGTPQPTTPISGSATATPNPYLASSQDIINSTANAPQAPSLTTAQMTQPLGAGVDLMGLLNSLLGAEQGLQSQKLDLAGQNYTGILNAINSVGGLASQEMANRASLSQPGGSASIQTSINNVVNDARKGASLKDIMAKYTSDPNMTADKILQLYNANSTFGPAKETPEYLASTYGVTGGFGKSTSYQSKKLPDGTMANFDPKTGKYSDPNTGKPLPITGDQVKAAEDNVSTAQAMMKAYQDAGLLRIIPGSEHFIPGVAQAQSKLFQSLGSLRRGAIGGRITQQEIAWLTAKLFPGPYDTDQVMQAKVQALQDNLTKFISDPNARVNPDGTVSSDGNIGEAGKKDPLGIL